MQELLKNAWNGWQNYTNEGKYAALLLLVLLFFWFRREECKERLLLIYTTVMVACCVFPISAALLMKYQTRFYDYQWIWSYVPLTIFVAYGAVIFLYEQREKWKKAGAILVLIILCGRMGQPIDNTEAEGVERAHAAQMLAVLEAEAGGQDICLWAPKGIMAAARGQQANISLIYGRNMWDAALGAYFYEGYSELEESLYLWMCNAEEEGTADYIAEDGDVIEGSWCIQTAKEAGVNRILLPDTMPVEEIQKLSGAAAVSPQQLEGYYLLVL